MLEEMRVNAEDKGRVGEVFSVTLDLMLSIKSNIDIVCEKRGERGTTVEGQYLMMMIRKGG